jgi:hypothetical protein
MCAFQKFYIRITNPQRGIVIVLNPICIGPHLETIFQSSQEPSQKSSAARCRRRLPPTKPKGGQFVLQAKARHDNPFDGHTLGRNFPNWTVLTEIETPPHPRR